MSFYINSEDGATGISDSWYVAEGLPGHRGSKAEATTFFPYQAAQAVIDDNKDSSGKLFGRSNLHIVEE